MKNAKDKLLKKVDIFPDDKLGDNYYYNSEKTERFL